MPIRQYRPTSPGRRGMSVSTFEEITKTKPEKYRLLEVVVGLDLSEEERQKWEAERKKFRSEMRAGRGHRTEAIAS